MNIRNLSYAWGVAAFIMSGVALGESATFTGTVRATAPTVELAADDADIVARVRDTTVTASVPNSPVPVYTEQAQANGKFSAGQQSLLLELSEQSGELVTDGNTFKGTLTQDGGLYQLFAELFVYSGSDRQKISLAKSVLNLQAKAPIGPAITNVETLINGDWTPGFSITSYMRGSLPEALKVTLEPRNYAQIVQLSGIGECNVPISGDACFITVPEKAMPEPTSEVGSTTWQLIVDSQNRALNDTEIQQASYELAWDYRGPTILAGKAIYEVDEKLEEILTIDGTTFTVSNGKAVVVITSPHLGRADSGWLPKDLTLSIKNNGELIREYEVFLDGNKIISRSGSVNDERNNNITLESKEPTGSIDPYFVYEIDLSKVADGSYDYSVTVADAYGNKSTKENLMSGRVIKTKPDIYALYNYVDFKDEQPIYFYENVAIAGHNGLKGQTIVKSVAIDGEAASFEVAGEGVAWVKAEQNFTPGEKQIISVTVADMKGNEYSREFAAIYMPAKWKFDTNSPMKGKLYRNIQNVIVTAQQSAGETCTLVPNEQAAMSLVSTNRHYCVFRWASVPDGLTANYVGSFPTLIGAYQGKGNLEFGYTVTIFNYKGGQAIADAGMGSILVEDAPAPKITFDARGILKNGMYPVPLHGGGAIKAKISSVSAGISAVVGSDPFVTKVEKEQNFKNEMVGFSVPGRVGPGKLWEVKEIPAEIKYKTAPHIKYDAKAEVLYVPNSSVRIRMDVDDGWAVSSGSEPVTITLGRYTSATRKWSYDPLTMGDWRVYLATAGENDVPKPLTDKVIVDGSGKAEFDLGVSSFDLAEGGGNIFAVAELISPVADYSREIISNKRFIRVYKGEELQGSLTGKNIIGITPLAADIRYTSASNVDASVMGNIEWQQSADDGGSWTVVPNSKNSPQLRLKVEEPASFKIRAVVHNKMTGKTSTTEPVNVVAYTKPVPTLRMSNAPLLGEEAIVTAYNHGLPLDLSDTMIEWSMDEGKTWTEGTPEIAVFSNDLIGGRNLLMARMKYFGAAEDAGEKSMAYAKITVSFKKPSPPRVTINAPRDAEIGKLITLTASAISSTPKMAERIKMEWTLPDGTKRSDAKIEVMVSKDVLKDGLYKATLTTWIDGKSAETLVEKAVQIKTWEYEFPDVALSIPVVTRYAPSTFKASVTMPRITAPGVVFEYDWIASEHVGYSNNSGKTADVHISESGVHNVSVKVKDNRGNEKTISSMVEVITPKPMSVTLKGMYSTSKMRFPVDLIAKASANLGHPNDRIKTYRWKHNDVPLEGDGYSKMLTTLPVGSHTVAVEVESVFGQIGTGTLVFNVVPNIPPTCTLNTSQTSTTVTFDMLCHDVDGKIVKYDWSIDGEKLPNIQRSITVSKSGRPGISVQVSAQDDSWDATTKTAIVSFK